MCHSWTDHLWALVCVHCEDRLSSGLASLTGQSFWEGGVAAIDGKEGAGRGGPAEGSDDMDMDDDEWEGEVVDALESLASIEVEEG